MASVFLQAVFLRLRPGYIIQAIVYDNRGHQFNILNFFCFCVWGIRIRGSVRQIDVPAVLGTPARIVDSDVAVKQPSRNMTWLEQSLKSGSHFFASPPRHCLPEVS